MGASGTRSNENRIKVQLFEELLQEGSVAVWSLFKSKYQRAARTRMLLIWPNSFHKLLVSMSDTKVINETKFSAGKATLTLWILNKKIARHLRKLKMLVTKYSVVVEGAVGYSGHRAQKLQNIGHQNK